MVFSGAAPYSDPWHPFGETSSAIARTLSARGHEVVVREASPAALRELGDVQLVVVNSGNGGPGAEPVDASVWRPAWEAFGAWHAGGGAILGVHTAANTFRGWEEWPTILGGRWEVGVSGHPERSVAVFEPVPGAEDHPIVAGLAQVQAYDERYSDLEIAPGSRILLQHETADRFQPVVWAREAFEGCGRVVYDALGHDGRSYESSSRRQLLEREVDWLLRGSTPARTHR